MVAPLTEDVLPHYPVSLLDMWDEAEQYVETPLYVRKDNGYEDIRPEDREV